MPTRTGYVFLGWHGRNLIKISDLVPNVVTMNEVTASSNYIDECILLNGSKSIQDRDTVFFDITSFVKQGTTYFFYEKQSDFSTSVLFTFAINFNNVDERSFYQNQYTVTGREQTIELYIEGLKGETFSDRKVYPMLEEGEKTDYEPYYIKGESFFKTAQDRTLTAEWVKDDFMLTVNSNGGTYVGSMSKEDVVVTKKYGEEELIGKRVCTGYSLLGYKIVNSKTGSETDIGGAKLVFNPSTGTGIFTQGSVSCTLIAQWSTV